MADLDTQRRIRALEDTIERLRKTDRQDISSNGAQVPRSSGAALFAIDATSAGSQLSIVNNGTATPFSNTRNFSGLIIVSETTVSGTAAVFLIDGGGVVILVSQTGSNYSTTQGTASKTNVYITGSAVTFENKLGSTATYNIMALRTRSV